MRELIQELNNKYPNLNVLEDEQRYLYIDRYEDREVKKILFDFSQNIPTDETELSSYNEQFIAPYYYEDRGSIQWNYYVIFVVDSIDALNRVKIEKNKDYARKIVVQKDDFSSFLRNDDFIYDFYHHEVDIAPNLLSQWDMQLEQNRLEFICDNTPKSRLIDKLLAEDRTEIESIAVVTNHREEQLETGFPSDTFIQELFLNGYRPFPVKRRFDFSKVNLIQGVNGSGKTSLLEAIEIITCGGKTNRSEGEDEPNIQDLTLKFNAQNITVVSDNNIYKNRDKVWYGSTNERGNKLYENFNRFNFYHTDAANDISNEENINDIIKNIVLGNDVAKYEKKISDSQDEFSQEIRRIDNKYIPNLKNDITTIKEQLSSISNSKEGLLSAYDKFQEILNLNNWKKEYPAKYEKQEDIFFEIADLHNLFNELYSLSRAVDIIDISNIDAQEKLVNQNNTLLQDTIKNISIEKRKKEDFSKKIGSISQEIANLDKLSQWINIDNISKILGLNEKLSSMKQELISLENTFGNKEIKHLEKYLEYDMSLIKYKEEVVKSYDKRKEEKNRLDRGLNQKEEDIGLLNTYKTNLQNYTRKIILSTNQKEKCPVCDTTFQEEELNDLIEQITSKIDGIEIVKKLKADIEILEKELERSSKEIKELEEISSLDIRLDKNNSNDVLIQDLVRSFFDFQANIIHLKQEIYQLEELKNYFTSKGITEQEYSNLRKNYEKHGELSINTLKEIKDKYIFEITSQKETIEKFEENITLYDAIINKIKDERNIVIDNHQELSKYYSDLLTNMQQIKNYRDKLFIYFTPTNFKIENLNDSTFQLYSISSTYSKLLLQNKKDSSIEQGLHNDLENKTNELNILKETKRKLNEAMGVLNNLESSSARLEEFFRQNTNCILTIFMKIHAPKEFDSLNFSDNEIKLKRKNSDTWEPVNKISTGQKSALALAIFLTMNRNAKNAPKYILFDDPVSNTDDINILAFFDFLREIVLSNQRQIFFVTANSKIANLFRKKFDFLDDQFKYYKLER